LWAVGCGAKGALDGDRQVPGVGWRAAVGSEGDDLNDRLKLIENEVLEDVKDIDKRLNENGKVWKPPIVKVVGDKKGMISEWEASW